MTTAEQILASLDTRNVSIWYDQTEDRIKVFPRSELVQAEQNFLFLHQREIVELIRRRNGHLLPTDEVCRQWRKQFANTR